MEVLSYVAFAAIYLLFLIFFLTLTGPLFIVGAGFTLAEWKENSSGQKTLGAILLVVGLALLAVNGPVVFDHVRGGDHDRQVAPLAYLYDFLFTSKRGPG
jgi:drug/metabolite transporter (DMT)-like permease